MNGVEILSSAQVASEFGMNWWLFSIIALLVFLGTAIFTLCIVFDADLSFISIFVSVIIGLLVGGFIGFVASCNRTPTAYETHYKVTIDDSVSMNEFLDKYEILGQEGKIYTVKERE